MVNAFKYGLRNVRDFSNTTGEFKNRIDQPLSKSQVAEASGLRKSHFMFAADKYATDVRSFNISNNFMSERKLVGKEVFPIVKKSKMVKSKGKRKHPNVV